MNPNLTISAELHSVKAEGEKARTINTILLSSAVLGWEQSKVRPSELAEMIQFYEENQAMIAEDHEDAEPKFSKWARGLKGICPTVHSAVSGLASWEGFAVLMEAVEPIIAGLDLKESTSDPYLKVKRYFAQSAPYASLNFSDPQAAVQTRINAEIAKLNDLMKLAASVSAEDFKSFVENKRESNDLDEDGYVKLRSKKEKKD